MVGGAAAVPTADPEVVSLSLVDLTVTPSLREGGVDQEHVLRLADLAGHWPPILVGRAGHRVIDGAHRVGAARHLGWTHIEASWFEGGPDEALIEFVRRNVHHGLPLTLRERKQAGRRILKVHPDWSDRRIADLCGMSPKTVGRLRAIGRPGEALPALDARSRVGRDNRSRPVDSASLRARIAEEIIARPDASLRGIAASVGASPETVRSVRMSLQGSGAAAPGPSAVREAPTTPRPWQHDAALLSRDRGEDFVDWLDRTAISASDCLRVEAVPLSRIYEIADEARRRSVAWAEFARSLEARSRKGSIKSLRRIAG